MAPVSPVRSTSPAASRKALRAVNEPQSYWQASRTHRYSLLFALPLLVLYEALAALLADEAGGVRNGADVVLKGLFLAVAGPYGSVLFGASLIGGCLWLIARDARRRQRARLRIRVFAGMALESLLLAAGVGVIVGGITARLLGLVGAAPLAAAPLAAAPLGAAPLAAAQADVGWWTQLMVSLGAGLYEELLFRVLLVSAIAALARAAFGWRPWAAGTTAAVVSALVFAAFHYVGPYGDPLRLDSFVFRTVAGLFFSALFLLRGFGITAWTHALYDVLVLLL